MATHWRYSGYALIGVLSLALLTPSPAWAAKKKTTKKSTQQPTNQPTNTNTPPTNPIATAKEDLAKATKTLDDLVGRLTTTFEASPTFVEAKKKLDDATTAYDAARADVIKALEDKPEYKSPHEAELAAKAKLAKLREDTDATPEAIKAAGDEDLAQLAVVGQVERDALQADAAVQEKLAAIRAAQGVITKLRADFHTSLESNTDYTTAKKAKDDAQAKLNSLTGKQ